MQRHGLRDPLGTAKVIAALADELQQLGYKPATHDDLVAFGTTKLALRQEKPSPYFDSSVNASGGGRFFWMSLTDATGSIVGLQAFRIDSVDSSLAEWAPSYTIGLYMRRQEILVPMHPSPPRGSISERINGRLVYHGEIWINKAIRNRRVFEAFGRLGMLLALIRWNPDAVWGLASQQMATHGHFTRIGYGYVERGFFRWQWEADGIDAVEWVVIAERSGLEQIVEEMQTTPQQSRPA